MTINNAFSIGDTVYLRTDSEQEERIVTGLLIRLEGIIYYVTQGTSESSHYDFELTAERDVMKGLGLTVED